MPILRYVGDFEFFKRMLFQNLKGQRISKPLSKFMIRVEKPWGHEIIWAHTENYIGKQIGSQYEYYNWEVNPAKQKVVTKGKYFNY